MRNDFRMARHHAEQKIRRFTRGHIQWHTNLDFEPVFRRRRTGIIDSFCLIDQRIRYDNISVFNIIVQIGAVPRNIINAPQLTCNLHPVSNAKLTLHLNSKSGRNIANLGCRSWANY